MKNTTEMKITSKFLTLIIAVIVVFSTFAYHLKIDGIYLGNIRRKLIVE